MNIKRKVKFLYQCEENIDKLSFYLDISNKEVSCGPCLILKHYYQWALKNIYKMDIAKEKCEGHFLNVIEKLDYKVISNMEYEDFRDLLIAYFSLGEIYFNEGNFEKSQEHFLNVTNIVEESIKSGNKFQTEEIKCESGVVFFELLMWARKNLGDMSEGTEALELYESIIGEEECLYIERNYSIFKIAKELNMVATANDAARSVIKIISTYKGINLETVDYLTKAKDYENAIEIATEEYVKNDITHWINAVNIICREAEALSGDCVEKVIKFANLLLRDLRIVEWSTLIFTLYNNVRENEITLIRVLDYLRETFKKVKNHDFASCSQAILVLKEIYEDIRLNKYEKEFLRDYEFDFTMYLMNVAVHSESFEKGLESATKLEAIIDIENTHKDVYPYVEQCIKICSEKVSTEEYNLGIYPWDYLYDNLNRLSKEYGIDNRIKAMDIARNSSTKIIVGINNLENTNIEGILNEAIGEKIFHKQKDLVFISNEPMEISNHISDTYSYEFIVKENLFQHNKCCIMTYENAKYARLTDINIILVDGHKELRDMDITYINHILKESIKNKLLILINSKSPEYKEGIVSYNETMIRTLLHFNNIEVVDLAMIESYKAMLNLIIGEEPQWVMGHKFESFKRDVIHSVNFIEDDIKAVKGSFKERRYTISECGKEYAYIQDELNNNHKEFSDKVRGDINFLRKYAGDKIASIIPDLLEKRLAYIDDLEDVATLKEKAEEILGRSVENWCNKNIYKLMLEQFQVYIAKYSKFYSFHEETIERINENRKAVINSHPEFEESMINIEVKPLEELIQEFLVQYESFLQSINYRVPIIPNEKLLSAVKDGIKVMFLKSEEKAENLRIKIKSQVFENKENIIRLVIENIEDKLNGLEAQLQEAISEIFNGAKESVAKEKAMVEGAIAVIDNEYKAIEKKNKAVEAKMKFVKIEVLKFSRQVEDNIVYSGDKCYKLW